MSKEIKEWQTIETAPKDGTAILMFEDIYLGCINTGYWSAQNNGQWKSNGCAEDALVFENPSHWQPLPKPPIK